MSPNDYGGFGPRELLKTLRLLPAASEILVGYSGGLDSTALLVALHDLGGEIAAPLKAIHFHHGMHPSADSWQLHCIRFCAELGVPLHTKKLDLASFPNQGPESQARAARYSSVAEFMVRDTLYLTAHHEEDQAETVLLNLVRGCGIEGLAAIPKLRKLGPGWVGRPLLDFSRHQLKSFLVQRKINWINDSSNQDSRFDRNFLRLQALPLLAQRWPGVTQQLNRTAKHSRTMANQLKHLLSDRLRVFSDFPRTLKLEPLSKEPADLRPLMLRQWLKNEGVTTPPEARLNEFLRQLDNVTDASRTPELSWENWRIKRYRDLLWLQSRQLPESVPEQSWQDSTLVDLSLPFGRLRLENAKTLPSGAWRVSTRDNRARMQISPEGANRPIKDLLRESGVPPWFRDSVPVTYHDGHPVAIGDWWIQPGFQTWLNLQNAEIRWEPRDPVLMTLREVCRKNAIDRQARLG